MRRYSSDIKPPHIIGGVIGLVSLVLLGYFIFNPGLFSKLWIIIIHNWGFWVLLCSGVLYAGFRKWRNPKEFTWTEFPIQLVTGVVFLILICAFLFYQGSDVKDREVWNGYVTGAHYQETYDQTYYVQVCTGTGKNQTCTMERRCRTIGPSWGFSTNNRERFGIGPKVYARYVRRFGNNRHVGSAGDGCNGNRGWSWAATFRGPRDRIVPTAAEHQFVNFLRVKSTVRKTSGGNTTGFEKYLRPYPRVRRGYFGPIYLDRVINAGTGAPTRWVKSANKKLSKALTYLGRRKQVNILLYLVGTADQKFVQALEEHWIKGKKNDVVIIIGVTQWPKVSWAHVMSWTKVEEYKIKLRNRIRDMKVLTKPGLLVRHIKHQTALSPSKGGFKRMKMKELEYLASEVTIAWWAMFLVWLLYGGVVYGCSWALEHNEIRS
jgi:hypothetical protein